MVGLCLEGVSPRGNLHCCVVHDRKVVVVRNLGELALENAAAAVGELAGTTCDAGRSLGAVMSIVAAAVGELVAEEEHIDQVELENLAEEEEDSIDGWFGLVGERMEGEHSVAEVLAVLVGLADLFQ